MATSLDLLRIAFAAHDNHQRALAHRKRSKKREMWLNGARRCVRELTDWVMSVDGKWRNRHGAVREGSTPARVAKDLVQDMFYDCPGAWYGNITTLLRPDDPWGCITVNAEKVSTAKKFLRQYVRVTGQKNSRHDGGILLRLRPRKKTRQLLAKGVRRLELKKTG